MLLKGFLNVLLLTACLFTWKFAFGQRRETGFLNRTVNVNGNTYRYQVYIPANYQPEVKLPVILFLHGNGENGEDGILPTDHGIGTAIRRRSERFPAIVVFPQCRLKSVWFGSMETQALKALDQTVKEFNGDSRRLYLTGISLGAFGTWQFAAQHAGKFAAVVPIAGGIVPPKGFSMPPEVDELTRAGNKYLAIVRSDDPYAGVARLIGKTPVWVPRRRR